MIQQGVYKHYKGGMYTVLMTGRCSDNGPHNGEKVVVYVSHSTGEVYSRLLKDFCGSVGEDGLQPAVKRFEFISLSIREGGLI